MKITIEPSKPEIHYCAASIDTLTNEDTTTNIVDAALRCIISSGHSAGNVAKAAIQIGEEMIEANKV